MRLAEHTRTRLRHLQIRHEARTPALCRSGNQPVEVIGSFCNDPTGHKQHGPIGLVAAYIGQQHGGKGANIGGMDGHATYITYKSFYEQSADPNKNDLWIATDSVNGH